MHILQYYADMLLAHKILYNDGKSYVYANKDSLKGYALELAVKDYYGLPLTISARDKVDVMEPDGLHRHRLEVKSGCSVLQTYAPWSKAKSVVNSCSKIAYAFYVDLSKDLSEQYGYVVARTDFLQIGKDLHHIIETGTVCGGKYKALKTQTVWNNSKNQPHGTKMFKLEDAYINAGALSFKEYFN